MEIVQDNCPEDEEDNDLQIEEHMVAEKLVLEHQAEVVVHSAVHHILLCEADVDEDSSVQV